MARLQDKLIGHEDSLNPFLKARSQGKLASTFLFTGPLGIGKKLAALALAQTLVCERQGLQACGECGSCIRVEKESSESLMVVNPDGASVKIEQARDILQFLTLRRLGWARIVIIDQAHLLNPQAANSLLKSLEEPPEGTYFILISHLAATVLPTIRSRSQVVRFKPLSKSDLARVLTSPEIGIQADEWLLEHAQGSVEIAQKLTSSREDFRELEKLASEYLERASAHFPSEQIVKLRELLKDKSAQSFFSGLVQGLLRDSLRVRAGLPTSLASGSVWEHLASRMSRAPGLHELAELSLGVENDMGRNVDRGLILENFALSWRRAGEVS